MRMIIHVETRQFSFVDGTRTEHCSAYITSAGVTTQGAQHEGFAAFCDVMERALFVQWTTPRHDMERTVSIIGELPNRVAEFYRNADKTPYRCEPGRSRLAQLLAAYLTGQDIPLAAIWDHIQENVIV